MIPQLTSIALIGTAAWLVTSDPLHKFNHAAKPPVAVSKPVLTEAQIAFAKTVKYLNMLPVKK